MSNLGSEFARLLLDIGAIYFDPDHPATFKSGMRSPVYVDNRSLPYHPAAWRRVIAGFGELIAQQGLAFDVIAGIETAGIPHSAALGYARQQPSVFVRKQAKEHGRKQRIEGGEVEGKRVLLIEDLVTTGGSSLSGVLALRDSGAVVEDCMAIFSYGFPTEFAAHGVTLHTLTNFETVWGVAQAGLDSAVVEAVEAWRAAPFEWRQA